MGTTRDSRTVRVPQGRTRRLAAGLLAALLLGGAGCARQNPSVVAYVGDGEITQSELDATYPAVVAALADAQPVQQGAVINVMIYGELAEQIAQERGIALTDAQRDALLRGSDIAPLLADPATKTIAYDLADQQIVAQQVGPEAFLAEVAEREVKLNPRYGVLDPQQKIIAGNQSGSLSTPGAVPPAQQ